jgi:hypothetical protein
VPGMILPGGVDAGVVGTERVLLSPVSMDSGWLPWTGTLLLFQESYCPGCCGMPITLEALAGGVGKVCARSMLGRLEAGCGTPPTMGLLRL